MCYLRQSKDEMRQRCKLITVIWEDDCLTWSSFLHALDALPKASNANQGRHVAHRTTAIGPMSRSLLYRQRGIIPRALYLLSVDMLLLEASLLQTGRGLCALRLTLIFALLSR